MSTPVPHPPAQRSAPMPVRQRRTGSRAVGASVRPTEHALLEMQSRAGNRAATAAVQRARGPEGAKGKKNYRDRIAGLIDRFKKNLEPIDTFVKGFQTPTNAGLTQQAAAAADEGLKNSAAISGVSAASGNLLTESAGALASGMDAYKNLLGARKQKTGAGHHVANKKAKTKGTDAVVSAAGSGSYSAGIAKEATKVQKAADAAVSAEASGIASASIGAIKATRSAFRIGGAARKYKQVKALGDPHLVHEASLARLDESRVQANWAAAEAYVALDAYWRPEDQGGGLEAVSEAVDAAQEAMDEAREAAESLQRAEKDVEKLSTAQGYAKKKQLTKIGKEAVSGGGESTKAAAGIVTAVAAGTGLLASNPVGWGLAGAGAGLVFGVTMYKALRAATKRYEEVRHPERWAPAGETPAEASRTDSLAHALKFWKKVSKGERQAMAREIYALAAGPAIAGSDGTTDEMRESARALLIALKAGPAKHKLEPEAWVETLNDPAKSSGWIQEIAEQLASG